MRNMLADELLPNSWTGPEDVIPGLEVQPFLESPGYRQFTESRTKSHTKRHFSAGILKQQ